MPTLGTQNIATSYPQLLKTFTVGGIDGSAQVITDGDNTSSALSLSTSEVQSTGSFTVSSNSRLLGPVTFGTNITASTGTSTIGTLFASGLATFGTSFTASTGTATIGTLSASTATISTATIPLQLGNVTFGSNITASTGTATIGTLSAGTATISTATIPLQLGAITFGSNITASTGTATIGTESVNTSTIGTLAVTNTATVGTLKVGASGPKLTAVSYGTAALTLSTVQPHNLADTTTGTFALTGAALGDIVIGSIDSLGSTTGTTQIITSFFPIASNVVRYVVNSKGSTAGTIPAGTIYATAMRFTA
jgi:hypothetical protein